MFAGLTEQYKTGRAFEILLQEQAKIKDPSWEK